MGGHELHERRVCRRAQRRNSDILDDEDPNDHRGDRPKKKTSMMETDSARSSYE